jgi:cytoskeletal protein RodZ
MKWLIAVLGLAFGVGALAQEAPPAEAPKSEAPASGENKGDAKADAKKDEKESKAPASQADAKKPAKESSGTPQRFIPSEQVRSDFDVSFPVDI